MTDASDPDRLADLFGQPTEQKSASKQLPLPLVWCGSAHESAGEFLVGASNAVAARHLSRFDEWTTPATILVGPRGCGKSMLARHFVAAQAGEAVDAIGDVDEAALFHAWNRALASGHRLLIVAEARAQVDAVQLADLRTRLAIAPIVTIDDPDTALSAALIERLLSARGLAPPPALGAYVAARIERSYAAIHAAVDAIDALVMASGRPLGIRLARQAMVEAGLFLIGDDIDVSSEAA
ncbi:MAG: chromosomal replication initiator DnaA [Sphingopyxis sp.]